MTCSSCEARLAPLVDGELPPRERAAVVAHVDACAPCAALLAELRVVDALLLEPRSVRLAPNFTFATMAELQDLPPPGERQAPLAAFVVCYLVAAWLLIVAAAVLSPQPLRAAAETTLDVVRKLLDALGGIGHVVARLTPTLLGWAAAVQAVFVGAALAVAWRVRPTIAERLRG